ncbi:hypothetical protein SODALDRAFT_378191 [Sodiomyces alkalinus F11]|uniref:Uncharacterized protein n=1 Tax=Sodiomyces alkalinus (strain CBS 110278 / VKM F-3762 / F11) TaxID=1314773 RepID=A0A3N2PX23_SODAK|nr:hypothetical protein SODALDRAFT_378191 [Sodiomyces alkalinus F11]ROT39071.1 hypothetical protein SODALDRAFT_378191 [Sodiomyces alkalinus F11]
MHRFNLGRLDHGLTYKLQHTPRRFHDREGDEIACARETVDEARKNLARTALDLFHLAQDQGVATVEQGEKRARRAEEIHRVLNAIAYVNLPTKNPLDDGDYVNRLAYIRPEGVGKATSASRYMPSDTEFAQGSCILARNGRDGGQAAYRLDGQQRLLLAGYGVVVNGSRQGTRSSATPDILYLVRRVNRYKDPALFAVKFRISSTAPSRPQVPAALPVIALLYYLLVYDTSIIADPTRTLPSLPSSLSKFFQKDHILCRIIIIYILDEDQDKKHRTPTPPPPTLLPAFLPRHPLPLLHQKMAKEIDRAPDHIYHRKETSRKETLDRSNWSMEFQNGHSLHAADALEHLSGPPHFANAETLTAVPKFPTSALQPLSAEYLITGAQFVP